MPHPKPVSDDEIKRQAISRIRRLTDCQQAMIGYVELGEYRKAYTMSYECASLMAEVRGWLSFWITDEPGHIPEV